MPRLSCIIPVVGHAHGLETTLVSVLEHFPDDCEIIVVHSAAYDDPYDLKSELRFIEAPRRTGFVGCANLGIQASRAAIVHVLAAGLEATSGWAEAALARFADPKVGAVAPIVCNQFDSEETLAAGIKYHQGGRVEVRTESAGRGEGRGARDEQRWGRMENRSELASDAPLAGSVGDVRGAANAAIFPLARSAFYRRSALNLFGGGFPNSVGNELAAVELGLSLTRAGYQAVLEPSCKILGSAKSCRASRGFRFGLASERLFWRNLPTNGHLASLALHPVSVARELIGSLSSGAVALQILGRIAAYATLGDCRARHEQLRAAEEIAAEQSAAEWRMERPTIASLPAHARIDMAHRPVHAARTASVRTGPS